ncbi:MAG TPA: hypothetical protein VFG59_00650 [Anaeromyxobacter sp.]|nr:hypothetical protein [Anaeromyxobacter sp.]
MNAARLALTAALLGSAAPRMTPALECAHRGPYSLELVDDGGRPLPTFRYHGRTYVLGAQGGRYLLRVHNDSDRRVEVVASVDGRDVIDGGPAKTAKRGYIVEPRGEVVIEGFRLSGEAVAAFRFSSVDASYAARMGDARDVGVIGAAIFPEAAPLAWAPAPSPGPRPDRDERQASKEGSPAASAAPGESADRAAGTARAEPERPGLGTGFGEEHESRVVEVPFERASFRPAALLSVRYDDRKGLLSLGIDVDETQVSSRERRLRESAEPFRSDRFAEPPPGWPGR